MTRRRDKKGRDAKRGSPKPAKPTAETVVEQEIDQDTDQASAEASEQASDQNTDQASDQDSAEASDQASDQDTDQASAEASDQDTDQASDQDSAEASDQDTDQAPDQASDQDTDQASDQDTDQASDQDSDQHPDQPFDPDTDQGEERVVSVDAIEAILGGDHTASSVGLRSPLGDDDDEIEITPRDRPGIEKAPPLPTGEAHLKGILESLLFVTDKPLPPNRLAKIARASTKEVTRLLDVLTDEYRGRGIELVEVAGGYQFRSSAENAPFVRELVARKPVRLTRAQIETLSILAYRQPITRPEVDEVRGVDSGSALKVLLEKGLIRIIGRKEEPGRPLLYGTTPHFLEFFGLPSLSELPTLREYTELSDDSRELFQRRTGEAIDQIGDLGVDSRHYSDEEVEAEEAEHARRIHGGDDASGESEPPDEGPAEPDAQGELQLDGTDSDVPPASDASEEEVERVVGDDEDDDEDEDDEDDDEDDEDDEDEDEDDEE